MPLAAELARLSAEEMISGIGFPRALPRSLRRAAALPFVGLSARLGATLARFDDNVHDTSIDRAAARALGELGATLTVRGVVPHGPVLVASNHPGAFDALALMAACARPDLLFLADDRAFLRAMTHVATHLCFVSPLDRNMSARALKQAVAHLRAGGAVVQFGAGRIEADPAFAPPGVPRVGSWRAGTGVLAHACVRAGGQVVPAIVSGVHSLRAKHSVANRVAEARGVTTLALLLQVAVPAYRRVNIRVVFGKAIPDLAALGATEATKVIEQHARTLAGARPRTP